MYKNNLWSSFWKNWSKNYSSFFFGIKKNLFFQQEEFENQRKLHANIEQVVSDLAEARRDYDLLQVEYEKVLIANQQSGF